MKKYPKTEKYDMSWIEQNWMGPNPLWQLKYLLIRKNYNGGIGRTKIYEYTDYQSK